MDPDSKLTAPTISSISSAVLTATEGPSKKVETRPPKLDSEPCHGIA